MGNKLTYCLIGIIAGLLFIHSLGLVHLFDWDEINFAESAREMILTNNFSKVQINFEPFWEKPPLFFWLQSISMNFLGINEKAARLPNAICGIITLITIYKIGKDLVSSKFGISWTLFHGSSFLPHLYFKSGIIDPWFNLFIFMGIYFYTKFLNKSKNSNYNIEIAGVFIGLAILTKGPVAFIIFFISIMILHLVNRRLKTPTPLQLFYTLASILLITTVWYGWELVKNGPIFIREFLQYQIRLASKEDAGHGGFLFYHLIILFVGVFPASTFLFSSKKNSRDENKVRTFRLVMLILLTVVIVIFSLVRTKIVHYSSLAYFPLSFLATYNLHYLINTKQINKTINNLTLIMGITWSFILLMIVVVGKNTEIIYPLLQHDKFAKANINTSISWTWWYIIPALILLVGTLLFYIRASKCHYAQAGWIITITTTITVQLILILILPKIEKYTQAAAIEFCLEAKKYNIPIATYGYKSYAPYFYSNVTPSKAIHNVDHLLKSNSPKTYFIICKCTSKEYLVNQLGHKLIELKEKNGYVLMKINNQRSK